MTPVNSLFPGAGTVLNVVAVLLGSGLGVVVGHRLPLRTRLVVTQALGLTTLLMAGLSATAVVHPDFTAATGSAAPTLIVLGSLLIGGIAGSLLGIEAGLARLADAVHSLASRGSGAGRAGTGGELAYPSARERFIEGWLSASLLFCVGPLAVLGSFDDGMGRGIDKLALKSALDCFAALAFASSFGIGVAFAAVSVAVVQGLLTVGGVFLGTVLPMAHVQALTATGGLLLVGISLRLLDIKQVAVGDLLPALAVAPLLTQLAVALR